MENMPRAVAEVTLWKLLGPTGCAISLSAVIAVVVLTFFGMRARVKGADTTGWSWWLGVTSRFLIIFGLLSFASFLTVAFNKIGIGVMGDPEILLNRLGEAFARLTVPIAIALVAHACLMLVGPPRQFKSEDNRSRQQSAGG